MDPADALASARFIGLYGYGFSALLFALLALVLLTGWRGRLQGGLLVLAVAVSAVWALALSVHMGWQLLPDYWTRGLWALRNLTWFLFLIRLLGLQGAGQPADARRLRRARAAMFALTLIIVLPLQVLLPAGQDALYSDLSVARLLFQLAASVVGLVLVEQVFRNTPWQHRWGIKFLCLGVGGLFAFDFFLYADALLFQRLDPNLWAARGAVTALSAPLIGVAAARNPQWSFDLFVSRKVVFHSTALFAAGIYLLLMSLVGYYIRYLGGEWSAALQVIFFFGAGMVLIVLLFSGQLRSRLKVWVSKHFFNYRYDYREEWLRLIRVLSGQALQAPLPERVIHALGELVDSPGGLLWLRGEGGQFEHVQTWNLPEDTIDKGADFGGLADFLRQRLWVINLAELRRDAGTHAGLVVPEAILADERLWLVVPLALGEEVMGFVILLRARAAQVVDWEVMDMLKTAARQAASYLALERAARALADARQFAGFNRLSAFVVHDLKNLIAQLSLVAKNAERHRHNPAFLDDAVSTIRNSVEKMNRLLGQLRTPGAGRGGGVHDLRQVVAEVVRARAVQEPAPELDAEGQAPLEVEADADRLGAIISHIVQNAQEATASGGRVQVRLRRQGTQALIEVSDTGVGMDAQFVRDRLFTPFDSTKGLTGMGVGAYEAREFVHALGGRVAVESTPGRGTVFRLFIPIAAQPAGTGPGVGTDECGR